MCHELEAAARLKPETPSASCFDSLHMNCLQQLQLHSKYQLIHQALVGKITQLYSCFQIEILTFLLVFLHLRSRENVGVDYDEQQMFKWWNER